MKNKHLHCIISNILGKTILTNDTIDYILDNYIFYQTDLSNILYIFKTLAYMEHDNEIEYTCKFCFKLEDDFIQQKNKEYELTKYDELYRNKFYSQNFKIINEGHLWSLSSEAVQELVLYNINDKDYIIYPRTKIIYDEQGAIVSRWGNKNHETKDMEFPKELIPGCCYCEEKGEHIFWENDGYYEEVYCEVMHNWFCQDCYERAILDV